jgi:hypothetical protein
MEIEYNELHIQIAVLICAYQIQKLEIIAGLN